MTTANIWQRVNRVQKKIGYIQKTVSVSAGGGSYNATSHDAVTAQVREHMVEEGIGFSISLISAELDQKEEGAKQRLLRAEFLVSLVNIDNPEDRIVSTVVAFAMDSQDKHCGKAMSMAAKYALLKSFMLETGESEESRYQGTDFDIVPFLETIEASRNLTDLKEAYTEAYAAATGAKDRDAQAAVVKTKNRIKAQIELSDSVVGQA